MCCPVYLYSHVYKKLTFWIPQSCSTWQVVLSYIRNSASHDSAGQNPAGQNQPAMTPLARIQLTRISHKRSQLMRKLFMHFCEKLERPVFASIGVQMQYPATDSCRLSQPPHGAVRSRAYFQDPGLGHLQDGFMISELTIESLICVLGLECL